MATRTERSQSTPEKKYRIVDREGREEGEADGASEAEAIINLFKRAKKALCPSLVEAQLMVKFGWYSFEELA